MINNSAKSENIALSESVFGYNASGNHCVQMCRKTIFRAENEENNLLHILSSAFFYQKFSKTDQNIKKNALQSLTYMKIFVFGLTSLFITHLLFTRIHTFMNYANYVYTLMIGKICVLIPHAK